MIKIILAALLALLSAPSFAGSEDPESAVISFINITNPFPVNEYVADINASFGDVRNKAAPILNLYRLSDRIRQSAGKDGIEGQDLTGSIQQLFIAQYLKTRLDAGSWSSLVRQISLEGGVSFIKTEFMRRHDDPYVFIFRLEKSAPGQWAIVDIAVDGIQISELLVREFEDVHAHQLDAIIDKKQKAMKGEIIALLENDRIR